MNGMKKCITAANHNKGWQLSLLLRDYFNKQWNTIIRSEKKKRFCVHVCGKLYFVFPNRNVQCNGIYMFALFASKNLSKHINEMAKV